MLPIYFFSKAFKSFDTSGMVWWKDIGITIISVSIWLLPGISIGINNFYRKKRDEKNKVELNL